MTVARTCVQTMSCESDPIRIFVALALSIAACDRKSSPLTSRGTVGGAAPHGPISEVMPNPRAVPDERGEWIELHNLDKKPVDLRGWTVRSRSDRGITIEKNVVVQPGAFAVLARDGDRAPNGGVSAAYAYREGLTLGNGADWIALRSPDGTTV